MVLSVFELHQERATYGWCSVNIWMNTLFLLSTLNTMVEILISKDCRLNRKNVLIISSKVISSSSYEYQIEFGLSTAYMRFIRYEYTFGKTYEFRANEISWARLFYINSKIMVPIFQTKYCPNWISYMNLSWWRRAQFLV